MKTKNTHIRVRAPRRAGEKFPDTARGLRQAKGRAQLLANETGSKIRVDRVRERAAKSPTRAPARAKSPTRAPARAKSPTRRPAPARAKPRRATQAPRRPRKR